MAGDWIKMRTDLYRDPKVCMMADLLMADESELSRHVNQNCQRNMTVTRNVMRNVTVGALVSVWGVMRLQGKCEEADLVCDDVALGVIDDIADLPGFGEAMAAVGWVVKTADGLVFPRFFEDNNVAPDGSVRSKGAARQQRYRDRKKAESDVTSDVTRDVTVTPREEKRREEKKDTSLRSVSTDSDQDDDEGQDQGKAKGKATGYTPEFVRAWSLYPKRAGGNSKADASKAFAARVKAGVPADELIAGTERYAAFIRATGREGSEYVKQAATFYGPSAHYAEPWTPPPPPQRAGGRPSINDFDVPTGQYDDIFERKRA